MENSVLFQQKRAVFLFLEYLNQPQQNEYFQNNYEQYSPSIMQQVTQNLATIFEIDLQNQNQIDQFSNLDTDFLQIVNDGLKNTQQAERMQQSQEILNPDVELDPALEKKFINYLKLLSSKGYFEGTSEGEDDYNNRKLKAKIKFIEKYANQSKSQLTEEEKLTEAENFKIEGNKNLTSFEYKKAIQCYTKAIELNSASPIYYSNRSAAYIYDNQFQLALTDAQQATSLDPNYSKGFSRLGKAYFSLGHYQEALNSYQQALNLEPNNQDYAECVRATQQALISPPQPPQNNTPAGNPLFNNPNMQNLAQELGSGSGGSNLFQNPNAMNMAQQAMQNPEFSQMLNNPAVMNMVNGFMQNPDALNSMISSVFGQGGNQPQEEQSPNEPMNQ